MLLLSSCLKDSTDEEFLVSSGRLSILTHKKIENTNESFIVYNDSAILNRLSEFP